MRSKFLYTAVLIALIFLPGYLLLGFLLGRGMWTWILLSIPFALIWSLPVFVWKSQDAEDFSKARKILVHAAYLSMGILTYLLVFSVLVSILNFSLPVSMALSTPAILIATVISVGFGTYRASTGPHVKEVIVTIDGLPIELHDLKIAQISDLHIGPTIGRSYVERVVRKTNALQANIIALTGDIGDGNPALLFEAVAPLADLTSTLGVYYIPGNHEYYWNIDSWTQAMGKMGAHVLMNSGRAVQYKNNMILIAGVTDPAASQTGRGEGPLPQKALQASPFANLKILLSHRPGLAHEAAALGYDLQLSGHTHGGQFFPWTLITKMVHEYNLGLGKSGRMWVYVNSGTGSWGPLLRLGTTPEITLLRVQAK